MYKKVICLVSVLVLCFSYTGFADVVIGDWEDGSYDGWIDWGGGQATIESIGAPKYTFSETGATLGSSAIKVSTDGGWQQNLSISLADVGALEAFMAGTAFAIDVTYNSADWDPETTYAQVYQVSFNNNGYGWNDVGGAGAPTGMNGVVFTDTLNPDSPGAIPLIDPGAEGTTITGTWIWDYSGVLDQFTLPDEDPYIQIVIATNSDKPGAYYFDNARLLGVPEPEAKSSVAYYALDGDANDSSGNELHGTIVGDPVFVEGIVGQALYFEFGNYVDLGNPDLLNFGTNDFTLCAWVNSIATGQGESFVCPIIGNGGDWTGGIRYVVTFNEVAVGIITVTLDDDVDKRQVTGTTIVNDGVWHHIAVTRVGTTLNLYVDGVPDGNNPDLPEGYDLSGTSQHNAYIGTITDNRDGLLHKFYRDGMIDEVKIFDVSLTEDEIIAEMTIEVDPGAEGLIASYSLDGDVTDSSGNGNDGTIMGDPNFVDGVAGQALGLDGDGDYVDCGANPLFGMQETNEMTAACWVTIRSIANQWAAIVAKGEHAWRLGNASLDPRFHFGITIWNAPDTASTDGVLAVGFDEWHHVAGVFDGANINLYVDGALDISVPTTEPIGVNELNVFIGDNPEATGRYWDGLVDEVLIYNRALSDAEIAFLAN